MLEADVNTASELFTEKFAQLLRNLNSSINGSVLLYKCSPKLCGVTLSTVPLIGVGAMTLSRYSRKYANNLRDLQSNVLSYSLERVRNISTVRLNNRESYEKEKFESLLNESNRFSHKRFNAHGSFMSFINLSTNSALIAVLRVGGGLIANGEMTVGSLTSFAIQSSFVGLGFSGLSTLYSDYVKALDAATRFVCFALDVIFPFYVIALYRIFDVVDSCHERKRMLGATSNSQKSSASPRKQRISKGEAIPIELECVSFGYKTRDEFTLNEVSLRINPKSITCFVGKSGSGKSTMASLLCGLYQPSSGNIFYGDELVSCSSSTDEDLASDIFSMFGVVEQSASTLFTGTIADNIEYGKVISDIH